MAALITTGTLVFAACGGDDETTDAGLAADIASATTTTDSIGETTTEPVAETTTTAAAETTTTATPTTQPDPSSDSVAAFADALETGDRAGLALLAPGSAAFVYYEGVVLLSKTTPGVSNVAVDGDTITFTDGGPTLSQFTFDDAGLITDFTRNDTPVSTSVAASGAAFEGIDEGAGIVGTVHSFRHFDGNLQVVVTTANNSQVEGELYFADYVSEGQEFFNVFSNSVRPTVTSTALTVFEDAPTSGGVLYGYIWADGIGVAEPTLDVPPLG